MTLRELLRVMSINENLEIVVETNGDFKRYAFGNNLEETKLYFGNFDADRVIKWTYDLPKEILDREVSNINLGNEHKVTEIACYEHFINATAEFFRQ